jgi:hypothetical protein
VVFSYPEHIRLNTWAAFSVDPTTPTGYSAARGVPTGRYLRPSSDANCIAIYRYDCNTPDINLNGPLFSRWDTRLKKQFPLGRRVNFELMAEVLNVFDTINFNHSVNFNNGEDTFRVTSAYTDINTTFDPGGRIAQLVWREVVSRTPGSAFEGLLERRALTLSAASSAAPRHQAHGTRHPSPVNRSVLASQPPAH